MECKNISFKANYLDNPLLINKKSTTQSQFNNLISKDVYVKTNKNSQKEKERDKVIALSCFIAFTALAIAMVSYLKSLDAEYSVKGLTSALKEFLKKSKPQEKGAAAAASALSSREAQTAAIRKEMWLDLSKAKGFEDLSLSDDLTALAQKTTRMLANPSQIKARGGEVSSSILLYGPPGTGKTTFAKAIAKATPNSEFASINLDKLGSAYFSETEKNITDVIEEVYNTALQNPLKKIFVFFDEIDTVMMVDSGSSSAKRSNDILNTFKKGMTEKLAKLENIVTIGATNLEIDVERGITRGAKQLDRPMLDRFKNKILVGTPTAEQIHKSILKHYQDSACTLVDDSLKDGASEKLKKVAEFLGKHGISFRTLESLYQEAATSVKDDAAKLSLSDFIQAIKTKATEMKINPKEITEFFAQFA